MNTKNKKPFSLHYRFTAILSFIALIVLVAGLVVNLQVGRVVNKKIAEAKEEARPANIELVLINNKDCNDCFDLSLAVEAIKKNGVNITKNQTIDWNSPEAQGLIKKYQIAMIPSLVATGELKKNKNLEGFLSKIGKIQDDAFVLTQVNPPYTVVQSGEIKGRVEVTMLTDDSCKECYPVTRHETALRNLGITVKNKNIVDISSPEGEKLLRSYNIKLVPTIILRGDLDFYANFKKVWPEVGTVEKDGAYVFKMKMELMGNYKNLNTGEVVKVEAEKSAVK